MRSHLTMRSGGVIALVIAALVGAALLGRASASPTTRAPVACLNALAAADKLFMIDAEGAAVEAKSAAARTRAEAQGARAEPTAKLITEAWVAGTKHDRAALRRILLKLEAIAVAAQNRFVRESTRDERVTRTIRRLNLKSRLWLDRYGANGDRCR